jgi:hypothetical protein
MVTKWNPEIIENLKADDFDLKKYEQVLEEMAVIIYSDICQLQKNSSVDLLDNEPKTLEKAA